MQNLYTIADHVLLPHQADYNTTPKIERLWRGAVERALAGDEDRSSVRPQNWTKLRYVLNIFDHVERARLEHRLRAGLKAAKVAVPYFGRGSFLSESVDAGESTIIATTTSHGFSVGDYMLIQSRHPDEFDTWDICIVDVVVGSTISLSVPLNNSYRAGEAVWPILFGQPTIEGHDITAAHRASIELSVLSDRRTVNAASGDDFSSYELGEAGTLNGGEGWNGAWELGYWAAP